MPASYAPPREPSTAPEAWMMQILSGFMASQYLHVAAKLRLGDLLRDGPRTVLDLAEACGADPPALYRLLRVLASMGVFAETDGDRFATTELGALLQTQHPASLHAIAVLYGQEWIWRPYGALEHSVRT